MVAELSKHRVYCSFSLVQLHWLMRDVNSGMEYNSCDVL